MAEEGSFKEDTDAVTSLCLIPCNVMACFLVTPSILPFKPGSKGRVRPILVSGIGYLPILASICGYWDRDYSSSPVVCLPVSTVNTVATRTYSFTPIPYFRTYTQHTYINCTHLYPAQNRIFGTKTLYSEVLVSVSV